jgi:hypothetical protein
MRINGVWVGWGLGDWSHNEDGSDRDSTVRRFRDFARRMYRSYMGHLADNNKFDAELFDAVVVMQDRLVNGGRLTPGRFIRGVLDLETQYASGFKKRPDGVRPIIFTIEGHMSDMLLGPCAFTAQALEEQGVCWWQPVGYNSTKMPFDNASGINEVVRLLGLTTLPGSRGVPHPFPDGTPWGIIGFSQGGIIHGETLMQHVLPTNGRVHWRRKDLRRSLAFGNPYRELNQCADWVPDPPRPGTQGISGRRLDVAGTEFGRIHREHSRHKDIYAENETDEVGLNKTMIYNMVANGSFSGGPAGVLMRVMDLVTNPTDGIFDAARSIISGGMFLFNMGPHGMYDLGPCIEWMRGVKG